VAGSRARPELTRDDLTDELTPEAIRQLPIAVLRCLVEPGNRILGAEDQASFGAALHEVMSEAARRVASQVSSSEWAAVLRDAHDAGSRGAASGTDQSRQRAPTRPGKTDPAAGRPCRGLGAGCGLVVHPAGRAATPDPVS
jgi:hypothetical protein